MADLEHDSHVACVRQYHQATKHFRTGYAPSPGFLDWDSQPEPFRRYVGTELCALPLRRGPLSVGYAQLFAESPPETAPWDDEYVGLFLELSLGLSAWKDAGVARWALRNNPSSGNLHPTEGYLLVWRATPLLSPGLYHYAPHEHALELRATLPETVASHLHQSHPESFAAVAFTSIIWREEWKYGARAFRYCQHDVGHAIATARFASAALGWSLSVDACVGDQTLARCLGLGPDNPQDAEPEHVDLIAVLGSEPSEKNVDWLPIAEALTDFRGVPNRLSAERVRWPQIAKVLPSVVKPPTPNPSSKGVEFVSLPGPEIDVDVCQLIRQRRSAQRMDGATPMSRADFERCLSRTLPQPSRPPFDAVPWDPAVQLLVFIHAVDGFEPGLYMLVRSPQRLPALLDACASDLEWGYMDSSSLPLLRIKVPFDARRLASQIACNQGIAGRGAFSVAMLAQVGDVLRRDGAWAYRRLHWETGLIGQVLYLEAEASRLRGTGIGCFFDDEIHRLLGLSVEPDADWQCLYQFTVGAPIVDQRIATQPAYAHLKR